MVSAFFYIKQHERPECSAGNDNLGKAETDSQILPPDRIKFVLTRIIYLVTILVSLLQCKRECWIIEEVKLVQHDTD